MLEATLSVNDTSLLLRYGAIVEPNPAERRIKAMCLCVGIATNVRPSAR